jgi:two-component sensor histidine kinase
LIKKRISERWTIIGVAILMVLALGLLARGLSHNTERGEQLSKLALDRSLDGQRWQLELLTNTFAWNLNEEANYLQENDTISDTELIKRWLPVMRSRFAIRAIGVANDRGDEQILQLVDSMWRFTSTVRASVPARTFRSEWPVRLAGIPMPVAAEADNDPREDIWFSHALENGRDQPVWSEGKGAHGSEVLHISLLVRGGSDDSAYRVVHFDVDADAMFSRLSQWTPEVSTIELNSKGRLLTNADDTSSIGRLWGRTLLVWSEDRPITDFHGSIGEEPWIGRIVPLDLNGAKIYTGVMIGGHEIQEWNREARIALWSVFVLLVLLAALLTMVFLLNRGSERRVQRQERRSSVQARHLAKAIDEREVLDREVHHRVKNNLQVVSSLLNLQAQRVPDSEAQSEFMRGKRRIDSMALVHHKLYRQTDLSAVDLGVFLDDLAKAIAAMFDPDSRSVSFNVDAAGIHCDADTAIQLGMVFCELLANCHQHAFPYATGGHIEITVRDPGDGTFILGVKDNGKGFSPEDIKETQLGLEVVEALTDQLDGTMRVTHDGGTFVEVTFRSDRYAK